MSASPLPHFLQSAVCGEHVNMKTMQCRQPTERSVVIRTSETRDSAQPGRAWPCAQCRGGPAVPSFLEAWLEREFFCCQIVGLGKGSGGGFHQQAMLKCWTTSQGKLSWSPGQGSFCPSVSQTSCFWDIWENLHSTNLLVASPTLCSSISCVAPRSWPTKALPYR